MPSVRIQDQGQHSNGQLSVRVDTKPDKILFKGTVLTSLLASVCGDCGRAELRVSNPREVYEAWLKAQEGGA